MSAPPFSRAQALVTVSTLLNSSYQKENADANRLLLQTCVEQQGRLHALALLADYLALPLAGRKRQVLAGEGNALRELIETVWCELDYVFPDRVVQAARSAVEDEGCFLSTSEHEGQVMSKESYSKALQAG